MRRMLRTDAAAVGVVLVAVATMVAFSVCTVRPRQGRTGTARPGGTIAASLSEWHVRLSADRLAAGKYASAIRNDGKEEHELIAFKLDSATQPIPLDEAGEVDEDALHKVTDGPDMAAGRSQTRVVDLTSPGTYIFMCNLAGHYAAGMHTIVTVTAK
jgi:uncharacterized cupredoxin-like copper-binding protein